MKTWLHKTISVGQFCLFFILVLFAIFMIGHFGMQYGINSEDINSFLNRTWLVWLLVRWSMYVGVGYFLWTLGQRYVLSASKENVDHSVNRVAYKRLVWVAIAGAIILECNALYRVIGE